MVHGLALEGGRALWYRNRWINSRTAATALERPAAPGPRRGGNDTVNTNVVEIGGRIFAVVEAGSFPVELARTLEEQRYNPFDGTLAGSFTGHPHRDPLTGETHAVAYDGRVWESVRHVVLAPSGQVVRDVPVAVAHGPCIHDCAITARFVIVLDLPVTFSFRALLAGYRFPFRWNPDHGARVGLLPRQGEGADILWCAVEPCFVFHTANAYDDADGRVILDVIAYGTVFASPGGGLDTPGRLERWIIDPSTGRVERRVTDPAAQEFPASMSGASGSATATFTRSASRPTATRSSPVRRSSTSTTSRRANATCTTSAPITSRGVRLRPGADRVRRGRGLARRARHRHRPRRDRLHRPRRARVRRPARGPGPPRTPDPAGLPRQLVPGAHPGLRGRVRCRDRPLPGPRAAAVRPITAVTGSPGPPAGFEDASLDAGEAGALEVQTDELGMSRAVEGCPDGHRLGREAAVREADHRRGAGAQHARDLGQDGHGALEIPDRDADQCGVDAGRVERQARLGVEVLHEMPGQARVGGEFGRAQAVAGDAGITDLVRQVADPTRHQVEDVAARRDDLPVEVGDRPDGGGIDMGHEARLRVERGIGIAVVLGERLGGKSGRSCVIGERASGSNGAPAPTAGAQTVDCVRR